MSLLRAEGVLLDQVEFCPLSFCHYQWPFYALNQSKKIYSIRYLPKWGPREDKVRVGANPNPNPNPNTYTNPIHGFGQNFFSLWFEKQLFILSAYDIKDINANFEWNLSSSFRVIQKLILLHTLHSHENENNTPDLSFQWFPALLGVTLYTLWGAKASGSLQGLRGSCVTRLSFVPCLSAITGDPFMLLTNQKKSNHIDTCLRGAPEKVR